jgi:hypothetical protein
VLQRLLHHAKRRPRSRSRYNGPTQNPVGV